MSGYDNATASALRGVDAVAAVHLETGLSALLDADLPRAVAHLATISAADWERVLTRFPWLPQVISALSTMGGA